jgi:chemotaxis protein MotB
MTLRRGSGAEDHDEAGHYWISISDLMTSLLFIFILILAYTIFTFKEQQSQYSHNKVAREELLQELKEELSKESVNVEIDKYKGSMRLEINEGEFFELGKAKLLPSGEQQVEKVACTIKTKLTNYDKYFRAIDTVFIEGHTDSRPFDNELLSAKRAIETYKKMSDSYSIDEMKNSDGKSLFSYSGYAATRPLLPNDTQNPKNRRIEFFFAVASPKDSK